MSPFEKLGVRKKNQIVKSPYEKDSRLRRASSSPFRKGQKDIWSFYPFVLFKKDRTTLSHNLNRKKFLEQRVHYLF